MPAFLRRPSVDVVAECVGLRGRGLSEDNTGVRWQCGLHECRRDESLRFEVVIQDVGREAKEDLNHADLVGEENEGAGEAGGVKGSVEVD